MPQLAPCMWVVGLFTSWILILGFVVMVWWGAWGDPYKFKYKSYSAGVK